MTTKVLRFTMPNGTRWEIPVIELLRLRAADYADEFGGDVERSLREDSLPLFAECEYEALDWAYNNTNWEDVAPFARQIADTPPLTERDKQDGWMERDDMEIVDPAEADQ